MKKTIKLLFRIFCLITILSSSVYSQYGWNKIFENTYYGIDKSYSFITSQNEKKIILVRYGRTAAHNESGNMFRIDKRNNSLYKPYNNFLNSSWVFFQPNIYVNFPVNEINISKLDTSLILMSKFVWNIHPQEFTNITYNSGVQSILLNQFSYNIFSITQNLINFLFSADL